MADVTSRLRLVVDSTGVDRAGRKLKDLRKDAHDVDGAARRLQGAFSGLLTVLGASVSFTGLAKMADQFTDISNRLKLVTSGVGEFRSVLGQLGDISRRSQASLEGTVTLYSRVAQFAGDAFQSQKQLLDFTEGVQSAFLAAGASATEANNAVRQLTQALASGELRGEEFRAIAEQAPGLAKAIAEAVGGSKSPFELAKEGAFTTGVVIDAVMGKLETFKEQAADIAPTIGRAMMVLGDQFKLAFGPQLQEAGAGVARFILDIAGKLQGLKPIVGDIADALSGMGRAFEGILAGGTVLAVVAGLNAIRSAVVALTVAAATNPLLWIPIAVGALVTFRDEITRVLTPFNSFKELVNASGPAVEKMSLAIRGLGAIFADIGREIAAATERLERFLGLQNRKPTFDAIIGDSGDFRNAPPKFLQAPGKAFDDLADRGLRDLQEGRQKNFRLFSDIAAPVGNDPLSKSIRDYAAATKDATVANDRFKGSIKDVKEEVKGLSAAAQDAKELAAIFEDLGSERAALLAPTQRDADIIRTTADLLKNQAAHYKAMGADAAKVAQADAERIVSAKRENEALAARKRLKQEMDDQRALITAASVSEREERVAREILAIRREISDITVEDARAIAEQNVGLEEQLDIIREQRELLQAPFLNLSRNLEEAIINGGRGGVKGLKDIFKSFFSDIKASIVRSIFAPLNRAIEQSLTGFSFGNFGGIFTPGINGANPANAAAGAVGFGTPFGGGLLPKSDQPVTVGGLGAILGPIVSSLALPIIGLTAAFKKGTTGKLARGIGGGAAGFGVGAGIAAIAGGPIGLAAGLGALTFGLLGGLLGPKPSNKVGQVVFDPSTGATLGTATKDQSQASLQNLDIAKAIQQGMQDALGAILNLTGATLGGFLVNVEAGKRGIRIGQQGADGNIIAPQKFENTEAGAQAAVEAGIKLALKSITGGNEDITGVVRALANANASIQSISDAVSALASVADMGKRQTSQYRQAWDQFIKTMDASIASVAGVTEAEQKLIEAREKGLEIIRKAFLADLDEQRFQQNNDPRAGFKDIAEAAASVLSDTIAFFGDGLESLDVRVNVFRDFFLAAFDAGNSVADLTGKLSQFKDIATAAGEAAETVQQGFQAAIESRRKSFDDLIAADIGKFINGPIEELEALLQAQKKRADEAKALGADMSNVERLTALELRQFFKGLSDQAFEEVKSFIGLFEEASSAVARNLDLSRQDLEGQRDSFRNFAEQFAGIQTDFRERFVAASPRESLDILRGRAQDLLGKIGQGNESAAQALPQVLNNLVENARTSFGNTKSFQEVLDFATDIAAQAEKAALQVVSDTERQIMALDESNDILTEIRDILSSAQATNAFFQSFASGGVASADELLKVLQGGAGLTFASNDNAAALNITSLIAQSMSPVLAPLAGSIDTFTQRLADMPNLMRLQIEATDRGSGEIVFALSDVSNRLDRLETLEKKQLEELESISRVA